MLFCPNCDNILNISKNPPKSSNLGVIGNLSTPDTISNSSDSDMDIEKENDDKQIELFEQTITKLLAGEIIPDSTLSEINFIQLTKNKTYQKLDKKQKSLIQSKLSSYIEKMDDATNAYYFCKNCLYSKIIDAGSLIVTRAAGGGADTTVTKYVNFNKLRNRIYNKSLPITRNYICINDKCDTNKTDKLRKDKEAVFYRLGTSIQVWYTCKVCGNSWQGE